MSNMNSERVLSVHHWNDTLFSFKCTRDPGLRFENGQFVMIGLEVEGRPLMRAYSIASPNYEEHLEFFSIKVQDGPLTSRLQHLKPGDKVLVGKKPTGTLLISDLHPGRHLYLLGTGTGLAPWLSVIKDPETYERFDKVILTHGVRFEKDLAYREYFEKELPQHEFLGETIREKLPEGFQRAEYLLEHGMLDRVTHRKHLRAELVTILRMLTRQSAPIVADLPAPGAIPVALPDAPAEPSAAFQPADAAPVTAETPGPVPAAARKNAKA